MAEENEPKRRAGPRFHGRVAGTGRVCAEPGCAEPGEFRAPPLEGAGGRSDQPQPFRWLCLDHVRAFNSRYNFFDGMTADEIHHAQHPIHGWERETRAFAANAGDRPPRWADFADPLEAIQGRFANGRNAARQAGRKDGRPLTPGDRQALETLGLGIDASLREVRTRYSDLVRRFHPDRNGGDRSHEARLGDVIAAWQLLRKSPVFA